MVKYLFDDGNDFLEMFSLIKLLFNKFFPLLGRWDCAGLRLQSISVFSNHIINKISEGFWQYFCQIEAIQDFFEPDELRHVIQ